MLDMRDRKPINLTLDPAIVEELDAWVARQEPKTTRSAAIELAVKRFLASQAKPKKVAR